MRFSSILALLSGSHVICAPSFLPFVPPIFSSSTAPHSPSSSLCRSSFSNLSTPPGSSLSLARLLALPHLPRGTSASPSLSFPVLLSRGHVILGAPRAPTQPPLFSSPPLYPLPSPPLLILFLALYPCFPFSLSLSPSSIRPSFLSSTPLYYPLPLSPPPLLLSSTFSLFPKSAHFSKSNPFFLCLPATHLRSSPPLLFPLSFHSYVCPFVNRTPSVRLL